MHAMPILGSMRFGTWGAKLTPEAVAQLLESALELGIDTLDLADIYGDHSTNALVGAALALRPTLRPRLRLIAKIGIVMPTSPGNARGVQHYDLSIAHLRRALQQTLQVLGTEYVDVVMLHRFDVLLDADAITDWVRDEQAQGRVAGFGVSNFAAQALALFDGRIAISANQLELSLANSSILEDGSHIATRARGAQIQAWSPLGGGRLLDTTPPSSARHVSIQAMASDFGLTPSALLLRWVASLPSTCVVLGTSRADRISEAVHACAQPLPRDAWYALWQAARGAAVP